MTDISAPVLEPIGEFRIGQVLSRALTITSRNLVQFALITAVPLLPLLLATLSLATPKPGLSGLGGTFVISILLSAILIALSQAVIIYAAFQTMRGRPVSVGESLGKGLARFGAVIGAAIVIGFGISFGFLLLIVPGFILAAMWYVALPACVVETLPVFGSLGRSAELTKGHRWQIVGLYFLVAIAAAIVNGIAGGIFGAIFGRFVGAFPTFVVQVIVAAYQAVVVVVAYHDLRVAKEGVDIDRIAAVFD